MPRLNRTSSIPHNKVKVQLCASKAHNSSGGLVSIDLLPDQLLQPSMVNRAIRFFSLLFLTICTATFSAPTNSTSANRVEDDNMALRDCYKTARNIVTFLGSLVLTETLFCCYVLYSWARNFRINSQRKIKSNSPNEDVNGDPMYTDADEDAAQDQNQHTTLRNYQPLDPSSPSGPIRKVEYQPLSKNRNKLEKNPGKQFVAKIFGKPNTTQAIKNAAPTVNEDVGGLVYSQPYEDSVSSASQLKIKGTGSFRGKTNKNPPQEEEDKTAYYHVLEEDSWNKSHIEQPIPFEAPEDQNREDVYYYCDSDNPENRKAAPSKALPTKPFLSGYSKEPKDEVYYSCTLEESNKLSRASSNKNTPPFPQMVKEKSSKANLSVQQPYYHVLDNQSESAKREPTIKSPPNPLKTNPMINVHVIEEMKNRVANKKYGDYKIVKGRGRSENRVK